MHKYHYHVRMSRATTTVSTCLSMHSQTAVPSARSDVRAPLVIFMYARVLLVLELNIESIILLHSNAPVDIVKIVYIM